MPGEDIHVAGVSARLGFDLDTTPAKRFEARLKEAQLHAKEGAEAKLGFVMTDEAIEKAYHKRLDDVQRRVAARERFVAKLGADFDQRQFNVAYRQMQAAEKAAERERTSIRQAAERERVRIAADETRSEIRLHEALKREILRNNMEMERSAARRAEADRRAAQRSVQYAREIDSSFRRVGSGGGGGRGGLGALLATIGPESDNSASGLRQLGFAMRTLRTTGLITAIGAAVAALASLTAGAVAAASGLAPLVGGLAALPAVVGTGAQALGTIAIAVTGVGAAVKAGLNAQARAGIESVTVNSRLRTASNAVKDAQLALRDAHEGVADAQFGVIKATRQVAASQRALEAAGRDTEAAQRGVADAERGLTKANESAADAQENLNRARHDAAANIRHLAAASTEANRNITDSVKAVTLAERRLGDAQRDTRTAQEALTDARRDAKRALEDLHESASDSARDEQRAVLDLADARDALTRIETDPTSSARDIQRARLDVADAENKVNDAHRERVRLAQDVKDADTKGIEGSDQVQNAIRGVVAASRAEADARRDVADAHHKVVDAEREAAQASRELAEAQRKGVEGADEVVRARRDLRDANQAIIDSEQAVKDASQGVVDAQQREKDATFALTEARRGVVDAQRGVRDANEAVTKAQRGLTDAHLDAKDAVDKGSSSMNAYKAALNKLSPVQREFVKYLLSLAPLFSELQDAAGDKLFAGVERGVRSAMQNFGILRRGLIDTSGVIGDLVAEAGEIIGSKAFGRDFETQMRRNDVLIRRGGEGVFNLWHALMDVTIAAGPFNDWLSSSVLNLTEWIEKEAHAGRETGALGRFFDQTRIQADRLWRIFVDVGEALLNIGKQAYPLGSDLLRVLTLNAEKFKDWTESAKGQNLISQYFKNARPALDEFGRLVVDTTKAFFRLGDGRTIVPLLHALRTELLPALEEIIKHTGAAFGPAFVGAIAQIIQLFSKLVGDNGPLVIFATMLENVLRFLNHIIDRIPVIGTLLGGLIILGGLSKALGLAAAVTGVNSLISRMKQLRNLTATTTALGMGGGIVPGAAGAAAGTRYRVVSRGGAEYLAPVVGARENPMRGAALVGQDRYVRGRPVITRIAERQAAEDARGIPRTVVGPTTFNERYGNVPGARYGGPASALGQVRGESALLNGARAAGAGLSAVLGGPLGIAILAAVGGSIAVSLLNRSRDKFEAKQTGQFAQGLGNLRSSADLAFVGSFLNRDLPKTDIGRSQLVARGLATPQAPSREQVALAEKFRKLTGVDPNSERQLENLRKKYKEMSPALTVLIGNLERFKNSFPKLNVKDIIDPNAVAQVLSSFNRLRRDGALNIRDFRETIDFNFKEIGKAFTEGSKSWTDAMTKNIGLGIKALSKGMRDGKISTKDGMEEIKKLVNTNMELSRNYLDKLSHEGKQKLATNFHDAADAVRDQMKRAGKVTKEGMQEVRDLLAKELQVYGFTLREARNELKPGTRFDAGPEEGSRGPGHAQGGYYARGGWIGGKGLVGRDTVQIAPRVWAAPGEWHGVNHYGRGGVVINRHQAPFAEAALRRSGGPYSSLTALGNAPGNQPGILNRAMQSAFGFGLGSLFKNVRRPHYLARGGFLQLPASFRSDHQTAGLPGYPAKDFFAPHGTPVGAPISGRIVKLSGQAGGPGGGGAFGYSIYESGQGKTYFLTHFGSRRVRLGQMVRRGQVLGTVADYPDRADHIHEGLHGGETGVSGAGGYTAARLRTPRVTGGGAVGAAVGRALRLATASAQSLLDSAAGSSSFGQPTVGMGPTGAGNAANMALGQRLAASLYNWTGRQWTALKNLWTGESGWDEHADNPHSDAYGIPQANPGSKMASEGPDWHDNPATQIRWGLKYIKETPGYGDPVTTYAKWLSRSPHWYDAGGTYHLDRGGGYSIGKLRKMQGDRIADIDDLNDDIERDSSVYESKDRIFGRTEEVYVDEKTGAVDQKAIERRASELSALLKIRKRMQEKMERMKRILQRVIETYTTIIEKLREQYHHANKKDRSGILKSIDHYAAQRKARREQLQDLGFDLQDIGFDISELTAEGASLRKIVPGTPEGSDAGGGDTDVTSPEPAAPDTPGGEAQLSADQQALLAQAENLKAIVSRGVFLDTTAQGILSGTSNPNTVGQAAPSPVANGTAAFSPELQAKAAAMGVDLAATPGKVAAAAAGGGTTIINNINTLTPADPDMLANIARASNAGNTYLGTVSSPRTDLGL